MYADDGIAHAPTIRSAVPRRRASSTANRNAASAPGDPSTPTTTAPFAGWGATCGATGLVSMPSCSPASGRPPSALPPNPRCGEAASPIRAVTDVHRVRAAMLGDRPGTAGGSDGGAPVPETTTDLPIAPLGAEELARIDA